MTNNEIVEKMKTYTAKTHQPVTFALLREWTGYDKDTCWELVKKLRRQGIVLKNDFGYYVNDIAVKPADPPPSPIIIPEPQKNVLQGKLRRNTLSFKTFIAQFLDMTALSVALIIEIAIMSVSMFLISPGMIERIAMIGVGLIIVLFSVHAFIKPQKWNKLLWAVFASVSFFLNVSFSLAITDIQTTQATEIIKVEDDMVVRSLQSQIDSYTTQINDLNIQYLDAKRGQTVDTILAQMTEVRQELRNTNEKMNIRIAELSKGDVQLSTTTSAVLSADGIFLAIPTAIEKKRYIQTLLFTFIFMGLEITIVSSAFSIITKTKKRVRDKQTKRKRK
jgi:hypothetical protein